MRTAARSGFTLIELLVSLTIAFVLMASFWGLLLQQVRFSAWEMNAADTHDAQRILWTLLSRDVADAVPASGDLMLSAPDSLALRDFTDLGFACAVSANPSVLSVAWSEGVGWTSGDSLMVYTSGGWKTLVPTSEVPIDLALPCGTFTIPADRRYLFLNLVGDVILVGAPVRVFRWRSYHMTTIGSERRLARSEGGVTESLVGPLAEDGLRFDFVTADGTTTSTPESATWVSLVAALERPPGPFPWSSRRDTVRLSIPLRNR